MKAVICTKYGTPDVLQMNELEKPVPKENEVCIRIYATSVTSSDCIVRGFNVSARYRLPMGIALGFKKPRNPVLGMVLAGKVDSVGKNVSAFKIGEDVFGMNRFAFGTYAEYVCWPESSVMTKKPLNMTYEEAAALPYGGLLALHYLKKGNLQSGQKVLIYGASGAVGTSAVQLAKNFGADVTGVCSTGNLEMVKSLGADKVIDYTKEDFTNRGERYDLIFDAVPAAHRTIEIKYKKSLTSTGKYISVTQGTPKLDSENLILLRELAESGKMKAVIDRSYPLGDMAEAHRYVDKGHKKGNVIITLSDTLSSIPSP